MRKWLRGRQDEPAESAVTGLDPAGSVQWTAHVPGHDAVGINLDPRGESVFVADGWGVAYPSLALRRLALDTGEQRALVRLGNQARCLGFSRDDPSRLIGATDRMLFLLDRDTLQKKRRWREGVPSYTDTIVWNADLAFLACAGGRTVTIFDLTTGRPRKRRRVDSGVVLREYGDTVLACCGRAGTVWRLSGADGDPARLVDDLPFAAAVVVGDELWVSVGEPVVEEEFSWGVRVRPGEPTDVLRCHLLQDAGTRELRLPFPSRSFSVRSDGAELWASRYVTYRPPFPDAEPQPAPLAVEVLSLPDLQPLATLAAGEHRLVAAFDAERGVAFFTRQGDLPEGPVEITCVAASSS
jgi:hypothetical protein